MSLFKGEEVCVFSAINGVITYEGKPAAGAKIIRKVRWKDKEGESDSTMVGENGEFNLPVMNRTMRQFLPTQFVAHQSIYVHFNGQEYHIWEMGKPTKVENGELGGIPSNFRCELTDELMAVRIKRGTLVTSCIWDSIIN